MAHRFHELLTTPAVRAARARYDRADRYDGALLPGPRRNATLGPDEAAFVSARDGLYLASTTADGWPYLQFRGGPPGFVRVLDGHTLAWAELSGNRQFFTTGNLAGDDRVALFLMDYANRRRLKLLGRAKVVEDPAFVEQVRMPGYDAPAERALRIEVEAFDWNCPQHIPQRFTLRELEPALSPLRERVASLEAENRRLRAALAESE